MTLAGAAAFVLAMVFGVRRLCTRFETTYLDTATLTDGSVSTIILFVLASALITEALGIHLLFGAFLAGSVLPRNQAFVRELQSRFESVTVLLLLPLFFAVTGLRTSVGAIRGAGMWGYCAAIVVVAIAGKLGGSLLAARAVGIAWRDSAALGILMNTRGLMELVILNIGLDLGIISPAMFSMMVLNGPDYHVHDNSPSASGISRSQRLFHRPKPRVPNALTVAAPMNTDKRLATTGDDSCGRFATCAIICAIRV